MTESAFYIKIDQSTAEKIWHPVIEFESLLFERKKLYGHTSQFSFWYKESYGLMYVENLQLTFACPFYFTNFPFDKHECHLEYGSALEDHSKNVVLKSAMISYKNVKI